LHGLQNQAKISHRISPQRFPKATFHIPTSPFLRYPYLSAIQSIQCSAWLGLAGSGHCLVALHLVWIPQSSGQWTLEPSPSAGFQEQPAVLEGAPLVWALDVNFGSSVYYIQWYLESH
jgi:hypothetical protein